MSPEHDGGLLGDKTWSVVFDNTKIKTWVPGFRCEIPFREGIRRTIAGFEADESRRRIDDAVNRDLDHILASLRPRLKLEPSASLSVFRREPPNCGGGLPWAGIMSGEDP